MFNDISFRAKELPAAITELNLIAQPLYDRSVFIFFYFPSTVHDFRTLSLQNFEKRSRQLPRFSSTISCLLGLGLLATTSPSLSFLSSTPHPPSPSKGFRPTTTHFSIPHATPFLACSLPLAISSLKYSPFPPGRPSSVLYDNSSYVRRKMSS